MVQLANWKFTASRLAEAATEMNRNSFSFTPYDATTIQAKFQK